jgi:hypothetical protein
MGHGDGCAMCDRALVVMHRCDVKCILPRIPICNGVLGTSIRRVREDKTRKSRHR